MTKGKDIRIGIMERKDIDGVANVIGRAFGPTPMVQSCLKNHKRRNDPEFMIKVFRPLAKKWPGQVVVARDGGEIVGALRMVRSPGCQMTGGEMLGMLFPLLWHLGRSMGRMKEFRQAWSDRDPKEPHMHIDPLGVLPERQGQGIGSMLLEYYCKKVDLMGIPGYLETDREANVRLYKRFGFKVIDEGEVIEVHNWFMWRDPKKG